MIHLKDALRQTPKYFPPPSPYEYNWIYTGFHEIKDIESYCDVHEYNTFTIEHTQEHVSVNFFPSGKIVLQYSFDLNAYYSFINYGLTIRIADIVGFDVLARYGFRVERLFSLYLLVGQRFHLDLYINGTLVDENTCDVEILGEV